MLGPSTEITRWRQRVPEVVMPFLQNVPQAGRQRCDLPVDREGKPDGMTGGGVRVLANDDDAHLVKGSFKCAKDVWGVRQYLFARGPLRIDALAHDV